MEFLLLLLTTLYHTGPQSGVNYPGNKILLVTVTETGIVTVNRDTVDADHLAPYIQERLFKSYLGTGQMHDAITLKPAGGNVPEMVITVIIKEIKEGQKKALTEVSLQKYRKTFDGLDKRKQDRLKKLFPVLFQSDFM